MRDTLKIVNIWVTLANYGSGVNKILNVMDPESLINRIIDNYIEIIVPKGHTLEYTGSAPIYEYGVSDPFSFSYSQPGRYTITTSGIAYQVTIDQAASQNLTLALTGNTTRANLRCLCMDLATTVFRQATNGLQNVVRRYVDALSEDVTVRIPYSLDQPFGTQTPGTTSVAYNTLVDMAEMILSLYPSNY